jgi:hypothetical protein
MDEAAVYFDRARQAEAAADRARVEAAELVAEARRARDEALAQKRAAEERGASEVRALLRK